MINNDSVCCVRLSVEYSFANLFEWFVLHFYCLKCYVSGSHKHIVALCTIAGERTIVYRRGLKKDNPGLYQSLYRFSEKHQIAIKADQRTRSISVVFDRRAPAMFAVLLSCVLFNEVAADVKNAGTVDMGHEHASLIELMSWMQVKLSRIDIDTEQEIPSVKRLSREEMHAFAFGADLPQIRNAATAQVYGLYDYKNETIYILDSVDLNSVKGKSILLHELVHYLQYRNGYEKRVECKNQLEYMAYYLEANYLKEHGHAVGFTPNHLRRVAQCRS